MAEQEIKAKIEKNPDSKSTTNPTTKADPDRLDFPAANLTSAAKAALGAVTFGSAGLDAIKKLGQLIPPDFAKTVIDGTTGIGVAAAKGAKEIVEGLGLDKLKTPDARFAARAWTNPSDGISLKSVSNPVTPASMPAEMKEKQEDLLETRDMALETIRKETMRRATQTTILPTQPSDAEKQAWTTINNSNKVLYANARPYCESPEALKELAGATGHIGVLAEKGAEKLFDGKKDITPTHVDQKEYAERKEELEKMLKRAERRRYTQIGIGLSNEPSKEEIGWATELRNINKVLFHNGLPDCENPKQVSQLAQKYNQFDRLVDEGAVNVLKA